MAFSSLPKEMQRSNIASAEVACASIKAAALAKVAMDDTFVGKVASDTHARWMELNSSSYFVFRSVPQQKF